MDIRQNKKEARVNLGVCTGGGDCPGLNAAVRAIVRSAIGLYGMRVFGLKGGLTGLFKDPPDACALSAADVDQIGDTGGTILGTNNQGSPFRDAKEKSRLLAMAHRAWKTLGLDALIVIGGDGTQLMARQLVESGLSVVGVPKTIDNDLPGTELTIGFATAVSVAAEAGARLATSARAHRRIMILEVMGRDAGHIALHAGVAADAHAILIPEIPFSYDEVAARVRERQNAGHQDFLIFVAEGAYPLNGGPTSIRSPSGATVLGGAGVIVAHELHQRTGLDARATVLGHIQRGGAPNAADHILATNLGQAAVGLVAAGRYGRVVGVRQGSVVDYGYDEITQSRRLIPTDSELILAAEAVGTSFGRAMTYQGL